MDIQGHPWLTMVNHGNPSLSMLAMDIHDHGYEWLTMDIDG